MGAMVKFEYMEVEVVEDMKGVELDQPAVFKFLVLHDMQGIGRLPKICIQRPKNRDYVLLKQIAEERVDELSFPEFQFQYTLCCYSKDCLYQIRRISNLMFKEENHTFINKAKYKKYMDGVHSAFQEFGTREETYELVEEAAKKSLQSAYEGMVVAYTLAIWLEHAKVISDELRGDVRKEMAAKYADDDVDMPLPDEGQAPDKKTKDVYKKWLIKKGYVTQNGEFVYSKMKGCGAYGLFLLPSSHIEEMKQMVVVPFHEGLSMMKQPRKAGTKIRYSCSKCSQENSHKDGSGLCPWSLRTWLSIFSIGLDSHNLRLTTIFNTMKVHPAVLSHMQIKQAGTYHKKMHTLFSISNKRSGWQTALACGGKKFWEGLEYEHKLKCPMSFADFLLDSETLQTCDSIPYRVISNAKDLNSGQSTPCYKRVVRKGKNGGGYIVASDAVDEDKANSNGVWKSASRGLKRKSYHNNGRKRGSGRNSKPDGGGPSKRTKSGVLRKVPQCRTCKGYRNEQYSKDNGLMYCICDKKRGPYKPREKPSDKKRDRDSVEHSPGLGEGGSSLPPAKAPRTGEGGAFAGQAKGASKEQLNRQKHANFLEGMNKEEMREFQDFFNTIKDTLPKD
jgi:hypothetical protein